jgi:predicted kinase
MDENLAAAGQATGAADECQLPRDAARLREVLERDDVAGKGKLAGRPFLVALSGLPGTGKSYFARRLTQRVPFLVLESDRLRKALVAQPNYSPGEHSRVFAACHLLIGEYLAQGRRVLFDATNLTESFRRPLYHIADRLDVPLTLVRLTASRKTVRRRLAERAGGLHAGDNSDADWLVYCRLSPYEEPIQRRHFDVDSSGDISPVIEEIARIVSGGG